MDVLFLKKGMYSPPNSSGSIISISKSVDLISIRTNDFGSIQ